MTQRIPNLHSNNHIRIEQMKNNKTSNRDLKEFAYSVLKERLVDCIYPPGSLMNEAQLCAELELSRTPIREAISNLELEGLVKVIPKKGIYVTDILFNDILQIFQTRLEIEPVALRLAAPYLPIDELKNFRKQFLEPVRDIQNSFRFDTAMHLFIIEHCGNRYIIDMMRRVFDQNTRIIISSKQNQLQIHDAQKEHLEILDYLIEGKFKEAEESMRTHVGKCRTAAVDFFYSSQAYTELQNPTYKKELDKIQQSI